MKTIVKTLVVGLMVFALSSAPSLASMAQAGGINYEGFSSYKPDSIGGYDNGQTRGVMFDFSFGGPEDYKKNSSFQEVFKRNLTTNQKVGIAIGMVGVFVLMLIMTDEDDACVESNGNYISVSGDILGPLSLVDGGKCIGRDPR